MTLQHVHTPLPYFSIKEKVIVTQRLICFFSKTRLAPVKGLTIPRLELMAVLIEVRCVTFVKDQLRLPLEQIHLWTDSQCVLKWISSDKDLTVFVRNRVREIKSHSEIQFHYINTKRIQQTLPHAKVLCINFATTNFGGMVRSG